jgi:hypothetical protein
LQHEVLRPGPLLDAAGRLAAPGFARRPLLRYERPRGLVASLRRKEWDFYATVTREMSFSCAVADAGIVGVAAAQLVDFRSGTIRAASRVTPLGRGCALPRSSEAGDVRFRGRGGVEVDFVLGDGTRAVRLRWPRFFAGEPLAVDLVAIEPRERESMVIATPIGRRGFYYNRKIPCMPASGAVRLGERRFGLEGAFATLDWGRGVWPYRTFWLWASGAGRLPDGRALGVNLGGGFGDTSAATENCFFLDGRMTKLGPVEIDRDPADAAARAWRFRAPDGRLELEVAPDLFRLRQRREAVAVGSDLRQITGRFTGFVVTDAGERIEVENVIGWAEEHRARW